VTIANPDTPHGVDMKNDSSSDARKRLLINRHIAKMTPGEIARRFSMYVVLRTACSSARSHGKSGAVKAN
jgi:hypothetical protein